MTLEEKVGQLVQYSAGQPTGPGTGRTDCDDMIQKGEVGALFNITTAHQVNGYQHIALGRSRLRIPLLVGAQLSAIVLDEALKAHKSRPSTVLTASADITNAGPRAGTETVQVYLRLQGTSVAQPVRALAGFQRITLAPGETKKVTFLLGPEAFAIWNDQQRFAAEPAKLTLWIAPDSTQGLSSRLEITK